MGSEMENYIHEFQGEMEKGGLVADRIVTDAKIHRCGTFDKPRSKNAWYVFYGDDPASGAFGDWRTGQTIKWTSRNGNLSAADRILFKKRLEEAQRARREEEIKRQDTAKKRANKIFGLSAPASADHPYLIKKNSKPFGEIRAMKNLLVLAVMDETGAVTSLQFISPDGSKRFLRDGRVHGGYFPIKGTDGPLYICEGYATGATIHEATGGTVLCALNAGNLEPVARMARRKYPSREIVIAADNDQQTPGNPGLTKGREAAQSIGTAMVFPDGTHGTDFNDLMAACGIDSVKVQLQPKRAKSNEAVVDLFSDLGNATRFSKEYQGKIRFCHTFNKWYLWDGKCWHADDSGGVWRLAKEHILSLIGQAADILDDKERGAYLKEMSKLQNEKKLLSMVNLSRHMEGIPVKPEELDSDLMLFNCESGTVDLRTFEYLPHDSRRLITKLSPFTIAKTADCPKWKFHIDFVMNGNKDLIEFLQRACGSCLSGENRERKLLIPEGSGANGKSLTLETLEMVMGGYAMKTCADTLLVKRFEGIPNDIARLNGARFVYSSETQDGKRLAESLVKELSGDRFITARFMRGEFFQFPITFKIFLATNHLPTVRGTDPAIWDRLFVIPFHVRIPEDQRRPREELLEEFKAEGPAILKWLIDGCHEWLNGGLRPPPEVLAANLEYRDSQDILRSFLEDKCNLGKGFSVKASSLYQNYETWSKDNGEEAISRTAFGKRLRERGFRDFRDSQGTRAWKGLGLLTE